MEKTSEINKLILEVKEKNDIIEVSKGTIESLKENKKENEMKLKKYHAALKVCKEREEGCKRSGLRNKDWKAKDNQY